MIGALKQIKFRDCNHFLLTCFISVCCVNVMYIVRPLLIALACGSNGNLTWYYSQVGCLVL